VVVLLAAVSVHAGVTITDIEVVGGNGEDEDSPIPAEEDYTLRCNLNNDEDSTFTSCVWSHMIDGAYDDASGEFEVRCSAGDPNTDSGKTCTNTGGDDEVDGYSSKISMDVGTNFCGIRISSAEYWDNGEWTCSVSDGINSIDHSSIDIWVANMSTLHFSDPDQIDDDSVTVLYDYADEDRREIEATCQAYGAIPAVTAFTWYLDNDRNEIDPDDLDATSISSGRDGDAMYYEQKIRWAPTIEDMCDKYDLDQEVCDHNKQKYRNFEFKLICRAEQGDYFTNELDDEEAEIIVEVHDGAASIAGSLATLTLSVIVALRNSSQ